MSEDGCDQPADRRPGDWFVHVGGEQGELESTTSASLRHVLNSAAAQGKEHRMPLEYRARVQEAGNNNFPFSSHDNRHDICNAAEYFDLGMGLRKLDPEKQKQNSHNFFEWARAPGRNSSEGFVTVYQTSFVADQTPGNQSRCCRRYPKHHTQNQCSGQNQCCDKSAPEDDKAV
ncbi:PREDICTED: testis-expressed sequence 36 protein [Pseudopodoces humilis]|uniref:testis-expressed sequence 36 protein n=1 Tax=Pseudopodoces humilis TaxID=181119 RepID=UPI00039583BA|nr:PREDICTED: testis-expressed sequence 36 protein [Pseudopodoces humilis]